MPSDRRRVVESHVVGRLKIEAMSKPLLSRWTVSLGIWGVPVRLHMLLLLFIVLTLTYCATMEGMLPVGVITIGVLLVSVALHEAAHAIAALRLGGEVDQIVLFPTGGLAPPRVPNEPEPQVFVAMVGPMVNLALVVGATGALVYHGCPDILYLFNPLAPTGLLEGSLPLITIKSVLWINSTLFLLNLLPAYPFDCGPALRALLWPVLGRRSAAVAVAQTARLIAVSLCVAAFFVNRIDPMQVVPLWAPLLTLAIFLFFSAQQDLVLALAMDSSSDTGQAYLTHQPLTASPHGRDLLDDSWLDSGEMVLVEMRPEAQQHHQEAQARAEEAYEDARVDDILARLHSLGFDKLSAEEQAVLQRASHRYRSRRSESADDTDLA